MNAWSQEEQQEELHESSANRLYECKPVKKMNAEKQTRNTYEVLIIHMPQCSCN